MNMSGYVNWEARAVGIFIGSWECFICHVLPRTVNFSCFPNPTESLLGTEMQIALCLKGDGIFLSPFLKMKRTIESNERISQQNSLFRL